LKRLLLAPLIFLITLPVFGESLDPKILCMRNRIKFDKERIAYNNFSKYSLKTWYPAIEKEKKEVGDKFSYKGPFKEPFKSIDDKHSELDDKWRDALGAERVAAIPILKLLGYENPSKYLYYLYAGYKQLSREYGVKDLRDIEGWNTAKELFGHKGIGMTARDDFCKLYGVEFDYKYNEINY
tara:strand:- start:33 stop:578 length:546 start_codon:yes stop_codon:yes gene_type:complete